MGYAGKLREKRLAIELRKKGLSYREIQRDIRVSKSTLSLWCRDVILSAEQLERLQKRKIAGAERGRIIGAKRQQQKRIIQTEKLLKEGIKEVGKLNTRDRFLTGIALYAADGSKTGHEVAFTNSNPEIIKFMTEWYREFCGISYSRMYGSLWIHENNDKEKAERFWSKLTKIPKKNFHKAYVAEEKTHSSKIRKNKHEYGVFKVRFFDVNKLRKIMGWISGILKS